MISSSDVNAQTLPFKAYEPTIELRDRKSRSVYIEVPYTVETGEAERIAVDWTARGGGSGTSCNMISFVLNVESPYSPRSCSVESHLQTQRSAVKMLHERILILIKYVTDVIAGRKDNHNFFMMYQPDGCSGQAHSDHTTLRSLSALIASLPASENKYFREEFDIAR